MNLRSLVVWCAVCCAGDHERRLPRRRADTTAWRVWGPCHEHGHIVRSHCCGYLADDRLDAAG